MEPFSSSTAFLRNVYARMLLTRIADDCARRLYEQGRIDFVTSCRGHEAVQVGSALCIEVGKDFTLPYYRDLGVVLTIGMTLYEVFRTYLLAHRHTSEGGKYSKQGDAESQTMLHWGYHKGNTITGPAPVATQILHAAGIAFACKLRKTAAVTIAYCGDGATSEPDFLEGITFAAQQQLPAIFICEQDCADIQSSSLQHLSLPAGLEHRRVDGTDVAAVYAAMRNAMDCAREGGGPILLEMRVSRSTPGHSDAAAHSVHEAEKDGSDPIKRCQQLLEEQGMWDEQWAAQLYARTQVEVERAMEDALRDVAE